MMQMLRKYMPWSHGASSNTLINPQKQIRVGTMAYGVPWFLGVSGTPPSALTRPDLAN
jgi:hypothetical protein